MALVHTPRIGITLGDLNGIGTEVVMKTLLDGRILNILTPIIYGSTKVLSYYQNILYLKEFIFNQSKIDGQFLPKAINVVNCWDHEIEITPGQVSKKSGQTALLSLKKVVEHLRSGYLDGIVTGPIDKNSIHSDEFPFRGHTEYLSKAFNATESLMLMVSDELKVGLVTEHLSIREIATNITSKRIELKIKLLEQSLKNDFQIKKPKIAVLGLNPHAGDGGLIGNEENQIIEPVITALRNQGKLVFGPFPADGFFGSGDYKNYDATLAMYHDQGLVAFKYIAFETGVNFTAGLPIVRTSPDHGTAYGIAGKNVANENSFRRALFLTIDIIKNRTEQLHFISTEKI